MRTAWSGLFDVERSLPAQCIAQQSDANACVQAQQIQPGTFTFSASAGLSVDCSQTIGGACSACVPLANGGCSMPGSLIAGQRLNATTNVLLDGSYGVWASGAGSGSCFGPAKRFKQWRDSP